ncbi:hypothetical protein [Cellulomonas alba]|uniref:Uncharacterized protein n=1 Tax=Cellulomonas alba TaxID=3053467 RepID=A0ABT7SBU6_9CELL|nr:hypothetical protein [Cellulomonas alba]MDM7853659.1 hypothetical protein [Cellulomonas alba]
MAVNPLEKPALELAGRMTPDAVEKTRISQLLDLSELVGVVVVTGPGGRPALHDYSIVQLGLGVHAVRFTIPATNACESLVWASTMCAHLKPMTPEKRALWASLFRAGTPLEQIDDAVADALS